MQENTTYYDDTRYDNLTSVVSNGAKLAKLSALDRFRNNANKIKSELKSEVQSTEPTPVTPEVSVATSNVEVTPEASSVEPTTPEVEPKVEHPSKEVLEAKTDGITFYNGLESAKAEGLGRKLRVAPQVTDSMNYTLDTLGVDYVPENVETETPVEQPTESEIEPPVEMEMPSMETELSEPKTEMSVETPVEQPQTFDFSALPGVGGNEPVFTQEEPQMEPEQPAYEEHMTSEEQDNRLNDYLNRDTNVDVQYTNVNSDLEEIRKLKREIEEARRSLEQVKGNVSDLQQKDNRMSEQLAMLKQSLIDEKNAVNQEILAETTEWNNLTQLVREKEALMGDDEFSKNKIA